MRPTVCMAMFTYLHCPICPVDWYANKLGRTFSSEEALDFLDYHYDSQAEAPEEVCPECPYVESGFTRRLAQALEAGRGHEDAERLAHTVGKTKKRMF